MGRPRAGHRQVSLELACKIIVERLPADLLHHWCLLERACVFRGRPPERGRTLAINLSRFPSSGARVQFAQGAPMMERSAGKRSTIICMQVQGSLDGVRRGASIRVFDMARDQDRRFKRTAPTAVTKRMLKVPRKASPSQDLC